MTIELTSLTAIILFTGLMWLPYIANVVRVRGLTDALGYPDDPKSVAQWADRMDRAHRNAIENLMIFAPLVLIAHMAGISNQTTVMACIIYAVVRVVHFFSLTFAIPVIKSLSFMIGSACQVLLAITLLLA
jgi:uncharacterized MAPEG superfamily protein